MGGKCQFLNLLVLLCLILPSPQLSYAQIASISDATKLSNSGKYKEADVIYDRLLQKHPNKLSLLVAKAFNLSWQGRYNEARKIFAKILREHPNQVDAISGMAYSFAWEGSYFKAKSFFRKLLELNPTSLEGLKGLAYVALWEKDADEAIRRFESLTDLRPKDADLQVSLAQSYLLGSRHISARTTLNKALEIKPNHKTAKELLEKLPATQALVELNLWGGYTRINNANKAGLRAARISWQAKKDLQLWLRYDNALTFDNFALVRGNREISAWFAGGLHNWNEKFTSRLEVGYRQPDSTLSQVFIQGEQVMYLPGNNAVRVGGFYGPQSDGTAEWMSYVGGVISLSKSLRLEPTYFYAKGNAKTSWDQRFLLAANYQLPGGIEFNSGIQYGISSFESSKQNLWGAHVISQIPVGLHWVQALVRYESSPGNSLLIAAFGLRFRLER